MGFNCGIIGLPNVGKSTLFNALTSGKAQVANYPFTTIEPHSGVVAVPEKRLDALSKIFRPPKVVPTTLEFVDIAGLVQGASKGEGLGNQFLGHVRNMDALAHVVRCFENENVAHVQGAVNPRSDIEVVTTELIISDLETAEKRLRETERKMKSGEKRLKQEAELYRRLQDHLSGGRPARSFHCGEEERTTLQELHLLTEKPVVYVANVDEGGLTGENDFVLEVRRIAHEEGAKVVVLDGEMEAEISDLPYDEREAFLRDLGISKSGLDHIIQEGYALLGLVTFFTHNEKELRAWTIPAGTKAAQAAGKIHSDFERGFIRAEVMRCDDLDRMGTEQAVKEKGLLALHGHDYVVQDGDVIFFRVNV